MKKTILFLSLFALITNALADDLTAVVTHTAPGASTGSIDLTVTNGVAPYTFSWTGPNGVNATTEDINNLSTGTYTVTVTDKYCGIATLMVKITSTTGISVPDEHLAIVISPNPTHYLLNIHSNAELQRVSLRLINVNGKTIQQKENLNGTDFNLNVSDISNGIYFIEVLLHDQVISRRKFIKN